MNRAPETTFRGGLLRGLVPVSMLALVIALTVALTALARLVLAGQGFFTQQRAAVIVVALGLLVGAVLYVLACRRGLRAVAQWQQADAPSPAAGALWGLGVGALLVVLPLLLAIVLPQHPAP